MTLDLFERRKNDRHLCNLFGIEQLAQAYAKNVIEEYGFEYAVYIYPSRVVGAVDWAIEWSRNDPTDPRTPPSCIAAFEALADKARAHAEQQVASQCGGCPPEDVAVNGGPPGCNRPSCDDRLANARGRLPQCASQICSGETPSPAAADFCDGFERSVRNIIDHPSAAECRGAGEDLIEAYERLMEGPQWGPGGIEGGGATGGFWAIPRLSGTPPAMPRPVRRSEIPVPNNNINPSLGGPTMSAGVAALQAFNQVGQQSGIRNNIAGEIRRWEACRMAREGYPGPSGGGTLYRSGIEVISNSEDSAAVHRGTSPVGHFSDFETGVGRARTDPRPNIRAGPE